MSAASAEIAPKDRRKRLIPWGIAAAIAAAGVCLSLWVVGPACPKKVVIATGGTDGAYFAFAKEYREILAESGVELEIRNTAGSVENIALLSDADSDVSLALVQGGVASPAASEHLQSLGSLYLEPVWIFHRTDVEVNDLNDLAGRRVAIGPTGSGTRALVERLLAEHQMQLSSLAAAKMVPLGGDRAADALLAGEIDAAVFIIAPQTPLVERLMQSPGVRAMSFRRAKAMQKRLPYLSTVVLHEGQVDLAANVPPGDVTLLAPAACLVARSDLHPALVPLLLQAATQVHGRASLLSSAGEFPSAQYVDLPLARPAEAWYRSGPSMLFRFLPFQFAAWLNRTKIVLLPLCTLLLPLLRVGPPIYRWRIRSKIYRWYADLRTIDQKLMRDAGQENFAADVKHLEAVERELSEVSVPLSYMEEFYNLRLHVSFVLRLISHRNSERQAVLRARQESPSSETRRAA
jgi:TRAP transporter TAXI family solute receptor